MSSNSSINSSSVGASVELSLLLDRAPPWTILNTPCGASGKEVKAQFRTLASECAKSPRHAGSVIMLADQLSHHVACRAHGRSTDGSCEDHMLGQLSDDASLHQDLLQLPQIKKTDPAGLDCSSYKEGKLGTSDVKGFEHNRFYKPGRHYELLAYCICQSKGQHFCGSRS